MGDTQQYRFSTGCRRLEAGAFSGSLGGHDSAAGLNNDNAGSRDRIQPDNPAAIERDIKSTIARIGDGIEVRRNWMAGEGAGREIPKPVVPVKGVENTRITDGEAGSGLPTSEDLDHRGISGV